VFLYAFDLIELNGDDLRRDPLVVHEATLTSVLAKVAAGIRFNEHLEFDDGEAVFSPRLQDGAGRHRQQAQGLGLSLGPLAGLAQDSRSAYVRLSTFAISEAPSPCALSSTYPADVY
jgi:hypothetical protein